MLKLDSDLKERIVGDVEFDGSYPPHVRFVMERVKGLKWELNKAGEWNDELEKETAIALRKLEA